MQYSQRYSIYLKLATPSGFRSEYIGAESFICHQSGGPFSKTNCSPRFDDFALADVNGDGKDDLVYLKAHGQTSVNTKAYLRLSNGNGFDGASHIGDFSRSCKREATWGGFGNIVDCLPIKIELGDVNGDGRADLVYTKPHNYTSSTVNVSMMLSNGTGFSSSTNPVTFTRHCEGYDSVWSTRVCSPYYFDLGDINGDGRADLVTSKPDENEFHVSAFLSTGSGFAPAKDYDSPRVKGIWLDDINGDGLDDLISHEDVGRHRLYMQLSEGNNFGMVALLGETGGSRSNIAGDFNGDGLADFVSAIGMYHDGNTFRSYNNEEGHIFTAGAPTNDLLTGITSPLGAATTIHYSRLNNSDVYTAGSAASYPKRSLNKNALMDIVSSVDSADGTDGKNTVSYHYSDGLTDMKGRGFLGFAGMTTTDSTTGVKTTTRYSQDYPYAGQVLSTQTHTRSGALISELENTLAEKSLFSGKVKLSYVKQNDQAQYELDGELISYARTNYQIDNYGNQTDITVTTAGTQPDNTDQLYDTFTTHTKNSYSNDTSNWFIGRLTRVENTQTTPEGQSGTRISAFEYNATTGLLTKEIIEPDRPELKLITDYQYDAYGNQTSVSVSGADIQTRTTTTTWGEQNSSNFGAVTHNGRFAIQTTNALGHSEQRAYDTRFGKLTQLRGPNGLDTFWDYDSFGRITTETRADGTATQTQRLFCDNSCPDNGVIRTYTSSSGNVPVETINDVLGRTIRSITRGRDGQLINADTEYNKRGEISRKSRPYFKGGTALWAQFSYDEMGRLTQEISADGSKTITGYDGLVTTITNALQQANARYKNVRGDVIQVWDADSNDTFYRYDPFGNLTETEDSEGNIIKNTYDIRGRKIAMDDPDMGHWTYQYNALGELISQTDAKGQTVIMEYDLLGRLTKRTESEGTSTWEYDTATNGIGKLKQSTGAAGEIQTYNYDELGRASQALLQIEGQSYTTRTTYDDYSRVSTITYPESTRYTNGLIVQYNYTTVENDGADGYLKTVANADSSLIYWQATAQDAEGHLTDIKLGNGLHTQYNYDNNTGLIDSIVTSSAGTQGDIQNLTFDFDAIGNLTKRTDRNQTVTGITDWLYESFSYDSLNRMTQSKVNGQTAKSYHYDDLGNITFKTGVGNYVYGNNAGPHAVTSVTQDGTTTHYAYDANGNMTTGHGKSISYTSYNKPKRILSDNNDITFSYGIDRSRIKRTDHSTGKIRYYIGSLFEKEQHNNVTTYTHYIKAAGSTIAIETSKSDHTSYTRYLHKDHLGSITAITDHNGLVVEEQSYDAHGKRRNSDWTDIIGNPTPSSITDRGFTGHEHIDEVGLVHMNGRVYDPALGRFISADPHIAAPFNSQSLNRYSYVLNNPLSYTDPSGFFFKKLFKSIFNGIGSIFKGTTKFIKAILNNKVLRTAGAIAIMVFLPEWHIMMKGFAAGFIGSGGDLKAGIVGALTAGAFDHVGGSKLFGPSKFINNVAAHGVIGGVRSVALGGKFGSGFLSGAFGAAVMPTGPPGTFDASDFIQATIAGGVGSVLGGGKFGDGAWTAAMGYVFDSMASSSDETPLEILESEVLVGGEPGFIKTSGGVSGQGYNVDLLEHELHGGHTIKLHVAKKLAFLRRRVQSDPDVSTTSSFYSLSKAEALVNMTLNVNAATVQQMMSMPGKAWATIDATFNKPTGYSITMGARGSQEVNNVFVYIRKPATTSDGFLVYTSFPH